MPTCVVSDIGDSLETSRPIGKEAKSQLFVVDDRVQSRLWQDPFEAIESHIDKERKRANELNMPIHHDHKLKDLAHEIHDSLAQEEPSFTIMPIMVDGSPYSNGIESRLRHRYAIVSALEGVEYLPESAEYIRFIKWAHSRKSHPPALILPVEWYKPKPSLGEKAPQVIIIWLKDQDFSDKPLAKLAHLVKDLRNSFQQAQFRILGPRGSGTLGTMVKEANNHSDALKPLQGVEIFSSWATAHDTFLIGDPPDNASKASPEPSTIEDRFSELGITLYRTIQNDAILAEQLIRELCLRNVNVGAVCSTSESPHHIALISEWDTLYGRVLPRTFVAVAENNGKGQASSELERHINTLRRGNWPSWTHHYSYLAGLDGELPPKDHDKSTSEHSLNKKVEERTKRVAQGMELPEGRGQLDYIRRLAKTLQEDAADVPGGYRAIGVLGSDVYDKLLILQALKKSFPQAIFFTTDLDAQLTHSGQWPWTRNLIIASHFGLQLRQDLQKPIPPFRDSYQTALLFSVLQALKDIDKRKVITEVPPRMYEIGRQGPFDLSALDNPESPFSIHPERLDLNPLTGYPRQVNFSSILILVILLILIIILAMLISSRVWTTLIHLMTNGRFWAITGIAMIIVLGLTFWGISDRADGEPFTLTEGISVWPTQGIRLLSFFLSGTFFLYSGWSLRKNEGELKKIFRLPDIQENCPKDSLFQRVKGIHDWSQSSPHVTIQQLWLDYLQLGHWKNRWIRYGPQAVLYLCFGVLLMGLFGQPHTPCRGEVCFDISNAILAASVVGMVLLIFFVVDATRLCRRLIKHLVEESVQWPEDFLKQEAKKRGVQESFVREWLGIDFIAQRTAVIGQLIYYPFIILFLMYVARHSYFDRWDFTIGLVILLTLNVAYAFGNAVALRQSAKNAKRAALFQLKSKLLPLSDQVPAEKESKHQIERAINAIKNNHDGAFLPVTSHPIFGAIALPSGGYGIVLLMEYLANTF